MPASLAETLYHAWRRAQHDITEHPAWGNLPSEQRGAWEVLDQYVVQLVAAAADKVRRETLKNATAIVNDEVTKLAAEVREKTRADLAEIELDVHRKLEAFLLALQGEGVTDQQLETAMAKAQLAVAKVATA